MQSTAFVTGASTLTRPARSRLAVSRRRACAAPAAARGGRRRAAHVPRAEAGVARTARSPMSLDLADDSRLSVLFSGEAAGELAAQINVLVRAFQSIAKAQKEGRRVLEPSLEYAHEEDGLRVVIECNPNLFPDAFSAKAYVVVDDGRVRISSQALLTRLVDNVKTYKAAVDA